MGGPAERGDGGWAQVSLRVKSVGDWWEADPHSKLFLMAEKVLEQEWGVRPLLVREGGTMPVSPPFFFSPSASILCFGPQMGFASKTFADSLSSPLLSAATMFNGLKAVCMPTSALWVPGFLGVWVYVCRRVRVCCGGRGGWIGRDRLRGQEKRGGGKGGGRWGGASLVHGTIEGATTHSHQPLTQRLVSLILS